MKSPRLPTNRLAGQTSPYLLQHVDNPVDWYPWGEEALAQARQSGKPILLSIGYSACHWCHVMAHESFEDAATADVMNRYFINIKVDREERPDIDKIYQVAHQLLTQRNGGWPLTMFVSPNDMTPFFGGTYFPPSPRMGMPAFKDLLLRVVDFYRDNGADISQQNAALRDALGRAEPAGGLGTETIDATPLELAVDQLRSSFDETYGGFGMAPKFPHPTNVERLLRAGFGPSSARGPKSGLAMAVQTLEAMANGGVYDHLGGGFYRYSTDQQWMIPHFEKMLYDNGPLLALYAQAFQVTGKPQFREVALGIGDWIATHMQAPEGGYYSTIDADSEGEEGKYYVWQSEQVRATLTDLEYSVFAPRFGLDKAPNFEDKAWHLHGYASLRDIAQRLAMDEVQAQTLIRNAQANLLALRSLRTEPDRDEKVLCAWNGLTVHAMATAYNVFGTSALLASANAAMNFLRRTFVAHGGRLLATYKDGKAHLNGYLDDYAFTIEALLTLLQARWCSAELQFAITLADALLEHFEDKDEGGFFFTSNDHEALIHRTKSFMDDALPSGNGVAADSLLKLGHLLGEERYIVAAERAITASYGAMKKLPHAHGAMLRALESYLVPPRCIVIRADLDEAATWRECALTNFAPNTLCFTIPADATDLPGLLATRAARATTVAYVCDGQHCLAPIDNFATFSAAVGDASS
ncbi:MAG: thioredoxin domain-containing protein [Gammaproteobacteria bacterium]|nr:thioredoxin domain-containing protein [Gammaproteobacteria bacterium]